MDIFELAKAKKMFGGGKREGTAIPAGQPVKRIYFNIENTKEETNAILSQLTFVQTPLMDYPLYAVYANTEDGDLGSFVYITDEGEGMYHIGVVYRISTSIANAFYSSENYSGNYNGWLPANDSETGFPVIVGVLPVFHAGQTLTDFNGIPVGAENEKIKNVLSITPF